MITKKIPLLLSCAFLGLNNTQATTLVFSSDFNFSDGSLPSSSPANIVGDTFSVTASTTGSVFVDNQTLVVAAEGGNNGVNFETNAAATSGRFAFDIELRTFDVIDPMAETRVFVQLSSGAFSTAASPTPNFSDNFVFDEHGADFGINSVEYFFNTSGADISITGGDGIVRTLANGSFALFVNNNLQFSNNTDTADGAGVPSAGVNTLSLQLFDIDATLVPDFVDPTAPPRTDIGTSFAIDNLNFEAFSVIPEPSSTLLLCFTPLVFLTLRHRKNI